MMYPLWKCTPSAAYCSPRIVPRGRGLPAASVSNSMVTESPGAGGARALCRAPGGASTGTAWHDKKIADTESHCAHPRVSIRPAFLHGRPRAPVSRCAANVPLLRRPAVPRRACVFLTPSAAPPTIVLPSSREETARPCVAFRNHVEMSSRDNETTTRVSARAARSPARKGIRARRVSASTSWSRAVFAVLIPAPLAACATAPPKQNTTETDRIIAELRAKNAGDARRIEELENQLFVLEDRLDSRRLAAEQRAPAPLPARQPALPATPTPAPGGAPAAAAARKGPAHAAPAHRPRLRLGAAPEPGEARGEPSAPVASRRPYRQALETLRAGDPKAALEGFRRFLDGNPRHDYADNAQYWIGECYYDLHDYQAAEPEFRKVIDHYPDGNKVPDAMLKLGFTLLAEQQEAAGRGVLESLTRAYPKHEAARLAAYRLAHPAAPDPLQDLPAASSDPGAANKSSPVLGTIAP